MRRSRRCSPCSLIQTRRCAKRRLKRWTVRYAACQGDDLHCSEIRCDAAQMVEQVPQQLSDVRAVESSAVRRVNPIHWYATLRRRLSGNWGRSA